MKGYNLAMYNFFDISVLMLFTVFIGLVDFIYINWPWIVNTGSWVNGEWTNMSWLRAFRVSLVLGYDIVSARPC